MATRVYILPTLIPGADFLGGRAWKGSSCRQRVWARAGDGRLPEWLFRLIFWWSSAISWIVIEILPTIPTFPLFCQSVENPLWTVPDRVEDDRLAANACGGKKGVGGGGVV